MFVNTERVREDRGDHVSVSMCRVQRLIFLVTRVTSVEGVTREAVSKQTWCLTSTETMRLIRDREKAGGGGKGARRWGKREGDYIPIATLSPPE